MKTGVDVILMSGGTYGQIGNRITIIALALKREAFRADVCIRLVARNLKAILPTPLAT